MVLGVSSGRTVGVPLAGDGAPQTTLRDFLTRRVRAKRRPVGAAGASGAGSLSSVVAARCAALLARVCVCVCERGVLTCVRVAGARKAPRQVRLPRQRRQRRRRRRRRLPMRRLRGTTSRR
jgi:hypothetical protein